MVEAKSIQEIHRSIASFYCPEGGENRLSGTLHTHTHRERSIPSRKGKVLGCRKMKNTNGNKVMIVNQDDVIDPASHYEG